MTQETVELQTPEISIDKIDIGKRFREDLGNIKSLTDSISAIGLLHHIVVARALGGIKG